MVLKVKLNNNCTVMFMFVSTFVSKLLLVVEGNNLAITWKYSISADLS